MNVPTTKKQMADFIFPSAKEQLEQYFNKGGIAIGRVVVGLSVLRRLGWLKNRQDT